MEDNDIGEWALDPRTACVSGCEKFRRHFGLSLDAPLTREALEQIVHPSDLDRWRASLELAGASGAELDIEHRVADRSGKTLWVHSRVTPTRAADGKAGRISGRWFDVTSRRETDLRVELSEESLRLAAEAAEIGTWDLDLTTAVLTWSDRTKAMFGISLDAEVSMADFYGGLHPEDFDATAAAFASAIDPAVRATYDVEYRTIGKEDGIVRWVAAKGKGLFSDGACRRAIGTAIDITARKQAAMHKAFLLDLMDRLRRLTAPNDIFDTAVQALGNHLAASRVGYGQVQPDGETILLATCYANGVAGLSGAFPLDAFGAHNIAKQRLGLTVAFDDVMSDPRNDLRTWDAIEARAFASVPLVREARLRATLFVNYRNPHPWPEEEIGLIEDVAARIWDALERARAEEALKQLNASLERQVEARARERNRIWRIAPVLLVVGDAKGVLLEANPAWTQVLGWSQEETIGHDVMEFVAPEDREAAAAGMAQLFAGGSVIEYQLTFRAKGGDVRRIAWTTVPEGDRLYGHGRDVTDHWRAEEKLRQSQKMEAVGQLTGGIAHDFNNLLTSITGGLELIQRRLDQGRTGDLKRYVETAWTAAQRAAALTQRLLAYARQQTLNPHLTDINALVAGMDELVRRSAGPEIEIRVKPETELWTTLADPHQLENALLNLCINARDAMPKGGFITIETANNDYDEEAASVRDLSPGQYVSLSVTDTGAGMAPDTIRRAFDPFFTTKPLGRGTGLGLSMVYGFARQSGGQVRIMSELGRGTCVSVILPRHIGDAKVHETAVADGAKPKRGRGENVLVVDDEAAIRMLVTDLLDDLGYKTIEALDGATGLKVLRSATPIDLLVTDLGLPGGMTGRQLAEQARILRPGLPVLFITGFVETVTLNGPGMEGFRLLAKPFTLEALAKEIRELVADSG